jgi:hypothetical protein
MSNVQGTRHIRGGDHLERRKETIHVYEREHRKTHHSRFECMDFASESARVDCPNDDIENAEPWSHSFGKCYFSQHIFSESVSEYVIDGV